MTSAASLSLELKECKGRRVLYASGEIDIVTAPILAAALTDLYALPGDAILDMSGVTFIDSSGLHALVSSARTLAESQRKVILRRPHNVVFRAIEVAGLLRRFSFES